MTWSNERAFFFLLLDDITRIEERFLVMVNLFKNHLEKIGIMRGPYLDKYHYYGLAIPYHTM